MFFRFFAEKDFMPELTSTRLHSAVFCPYTTGVNAQLPQTNVQGD
jgi:hypothetical protein